jgi:predicted phosphodiesterase
MRVFAVSDIHVDYDVNARWIANLSLVDYRDDVLILAGDVTDELKLLEWCLGALTLRFRKVLFVPGNHDLWVLRETQETNSLRKFADVVDVVESSGASMVPLRIGDLEIIPLLGWYDYSFGEPGDHLKSVWMDFRACRWPDGFDEKQISAHFAALNDRHAGVRQGRQCGTTITFSHFVPRIDLMPSYVPAQVQLLYPVLGATRIERQLRALRPDIHVYGHSHLNRNVTIDGVSYINNAFGYPNESRIASKSLLCIHEC